MNFSPQKNSNNFPFTNPCFFKTENLDSKNNFKGQYNGRNLSKNNRIMNSKNKNFNLQKNFPRSFKQMNNIDTRRKTTRSRTITLKNPMNFIVGKKRIKEYY